MPSQSRLFDGVGMECGAIFSDCRRWRYQLWRVWDSTLPGIAFIGVNPSTATELADDPTVAKCRRYAQRWGNFGSFWMLNVYGWRSTDPHAIKVVDDPVGPLNDYWIQETVSRMGMVVGAWGIHDFMNRGELIKRFVPRMYHLGLNKNGSPKHPLYLSYTVRPVLFN